jgi:hypothetical protein
VYWSENMKILDFSSKNRLFRLISRRKIDCAHSRSLKMLPWPWFREIRVCFFPLKISYFRFNTHSYFPESRSRKHFQASGMRAIDFSHKIRGSGVIFCKNSKKNFFAFNVPQFYPPFKKSMQKSIFPQKIQKSMCITTKKCTQIQNFKQKQFSRKLQRFKRCRKNKKCFIFHELSEYHTGNRLLNWPCTYLYICKKKAFLSI